MRTAIQYMWSVVLLILGLAGAMQAEASVTIAATRVIYNASEHETTIKLNNVGKSPALVQVWLDKGGIAAAPATISVPFVVMPPIARIDAGMGQTLRIFYTGEPLPQDKESVFWLNVLEVPPKVEGEASKLQLAFRSRIKFFYRPATLSGNAADAPAKIDWILLPSGKQVQLHNPTPYFVSFAAFEIEGAGKPAKFDDGGMVGPGETKAFSLDSAVSSESNVKVRYHAISDFGGAIDGETPLHFAQKRP